MNDLHIPYAKDGNNFVVPNIANKHTRYICPECDEEVLLARGSIVRPYFRHFSTNGLCKSTRNETYQHLKGKLVLANILKMSLTNPNYDLLINTCCDSCEDDHNVKMEIYGKSYEVRTEYTYGDYRGDIYIRRAMRYVVGEQLVMGDTKTQSSKRKIELTSDNMIFAMLSGLKAKRNEQIRESGARVQEDDLIFAYPNGDPYGERYIENSFNEIKKKAMITKDGVGLHTLRHSYATLMLVLGVDVKDVSRTLGHSKVAITYDTYSHVIA